MNTDMSVSLGPRVHIRDEPRMDILVFIKTMNTDHGDHA